jgi:hypothetical protein
MKTFGGLTRLKYGALAGLAGWLAGWLACIPFEVAIAWRYVDAHAQRMPGSLAEGLVVWAAFSLFMALVGFVPLFLPLVLVLPPRWIVRWRWILIPGSVLLACLAINYRMGLMTFHHFRHPQAIMAFFFTSPNIFVLTFAPVVVWVYSRLARRRLASGAREL